MVWLWLALTATVFRTAKNVYTKKLLTTHDEYIVLWLQIVCSLPVFWAALLVVGVPHVDWRYWLIILPMLPLELILTLLHTKAIKASPISLTTPFGAFTSLFLIISSYFILHERVTDLGVFGIFLIVVGAYMMSIERKSISLLDPLRRMFREVGIIYMLLFALLLAITIPLGKIAVSYSSTVFFLATYFTIYCLLFIPILLRKSNATLSHVAQNIRELSFPGLLNGLTIMAHWLALSIGNTSYVSAIGNLSILTTVLLGGRYFKEEHLRDRIVASLFMTIGTICIVFA